MYATHAKAHLQLSCDVFEFDVLVPLYPFQLYFDAVSLLQSLLQLASCSVLLLDLTLVSKSLQT
jgi:hypothetical protein